jgi:hypothetical protein
MLGVPSPQHFGEAILVFVTTRVFVSRFASLMTLCLPLVVGCGPSATGSTAMTTTPDHASSEVAPASTSAEVARATSGDATFADSTSGHAPAALTRARSSASESDVNLARDADRQMANEASCLVAGVGEAAWTGSECMSLCAHLGDGCSWNGQARCIEHCSGSFVSYAPERDDEVVGTPSEFAYTPSWSQQVPYSGDMECTSGNWGRSQKPWR